ncbi:RNA-dependent RNA polymerase [Erysiphe necator associated narnavirus 35]|nr:RNA-dependent RNA polymerase [Erysiphe necator associated narnavirus 35]
MSELPLWFNGSHTSPVTPKSLEPYTSKTKYLSTKQVPSCLILRTPGSSSVSKNRDVLFRSGFTLSEYSAEDPVCRDLTAKRLTEGLLSPVGTLASIVIEAAKCSDIMHQNNDAYVDSEAETSGSETENVPLVLHEKKGDTNIRFRKNSKYRIKYDDPWKIHAGYRLGEIRGDTPEIIVWSGDVIRLQDPLPPRLLGPKWGSSSKSKVRFEDIVNKDAKLHLIYKHTHWGYKLHCLCNEPKGIYTNWARRLRYRLNRFLSGSTDPEMPSGVVEALFEEKSFSKRARSLRLIELLKTVDGIFLQRYLCYPEEVWTWDRFDMFTLGNIACLLGDEFLDGVLTEEAISVSTAYSQLKASRKWFKKHAIRGTLKSALLDMESIPHWCRQFVNVWKRADCSTGPRRTYLLGILSQTRGAGTPPPLVLLQSKCKFLSTIGQEPPTESETSRKLRLASICEVLDALPQAAFTGLSTKARVTVTSSSSWEQTRRNGGTVEAAREILASVPAGEQIPIRDLDTGSIETYRSVEDFDSIGEALFWQSLECVLNTPREELTSAFLTMVKEPGKARTVTKARACLKIVLDLVNKICSSPLEKGIRSSASGMGKANHGWNLFCRLMSDDLRDMVFCLETREENPYEGYVERTDTFKHLFVSSTDYKEATDQLTHSVAADLGGAWMRKCGIPRLLRALVHKTCFRPREVFFHARGVLRKYGTPRPEYGEDIRSVMLLRGVLMGDPLTKPVLHLVNVVTRQIGDRMLCPDFYNVFQNAREAFETTSNTLLDK